MSTKMSNSRETTFVGIGCAALTVAGIVSQAEIPVEVKAPVVTGFTATGAAILAFWSRKVNIPKTKKTSG